MKSAWTSSCGALLLAGLVALAGCGASAHRDFDLNRGEATDERSEELANELFLDDLVGVGDSTAVDEGWIYEIVSGDQLEITFFTHPDQNRHVVVRPDGRISLPYVGEVVVAGRNPSVVSEELEQRYADVLITPQVDVIVRETAATYYVLGQVGVPGEFQFGRSVTLTQAVARAGGYTGHARLNNVVLLRRDQDGNGAVAILDLNRLMGDGSAVGDIRLRPFDVVWVPRDNIGRFDNAARRTLNHLVSAQEVVIKGWSLANFDEVFKRGISRP